MPKPLQLGIIGWPLGYSLSPAMHRAALKAAGLQGEYREIKVKPEELDAWLENEAPKLDGFNVTMPHKEAVYRWIKQRGGEGAFSSPSVDLIGSVNTVKTEGGRFFGANTDDRGFLETLDPAVLKGKRVLLIGAGGAAKAIAISLARLGISALTIWNRHLDRAAALAEKIRGLQVPCSSSVKIVDGQKISVSDADLIVQATPAGMKGQPDLPLNYAQLHAGQTVYDIVYEPRETRLVREARKRGCAVITGDEMLARQAAAAFEIWTGAPAARVLPAMKKALG